MNILCKTKGNASPTGKPRIYFTCHSEDREQYFDDVCQMLWQSHSCAVFSTEDMAAPIALEDRETTIGSNNLLVVPVTEKLLTTANRAMDSDIPYARSEHMAILPLMMEPGLDKLYQKADKFGELQYLNPYSTDATEISFAEKLHKYLESVLVSDETVRRVRNAFDAYIFLSYRKKDRRYANDLMRLIHKEPRLQGLAIWYDEFLTPGESFRESIEKIMGSSNLLTLLVTPNLLEEGNYVMTTEYPAAREAGIPILPIVMEKTSGFALHRKFPRLPRCIPVTDEAAIVDALTELVRNDRSDDPEHTFLLGLAYMDGIDVEVNRSRGFRLITKAADQGLAEAMKKLYEMYKNGLGVQADEKTAALWAKNLMEHYEKEEGPEGRNTLYWIHVLAQSYRKLGRLSDTLELNRKNLAARRKTNGLENASTMIAMHELACTHYEQENYEEALALFEKVYATYLKLGEEERSRCLSTMHYLALTYKTLGQYESALELFEKVYTMRLEDEGEDASITVRCKGHLADLYKQTGRHEQALPLRQQLYQHWLRVHGERHSEPINALGKLADAYCNLGQYHDSLACYEKLHATVEKHLGEKHVQTIICLQNIAHSQHMLGNYREALELLEKVVAQRTEVLGPDHASTVSAADWAKSLRELV